MQAMLHTESSDTLECLYENITQALIDDGYIVIEDAIEHTLSLDLFSLAKEESSYSQAGISQQNALHLDLSKRSDKTRWIDADIPAQQTYLEIMQGLQTYLNRHLYLGLHYYEAHFALYDKGDFYEKHLDSFQNSKNRVVTTVFYLNDGWEDGDGGELIIYDENNNFLKKVLPKSNTLVVFLSEKFPHEVLVSNKKRHSIAGWFRVDKKLF